MKPFESDKLHRFIFDNSPVRGEWVHLQHTWQNILVRREYPVALQRILGQMMAAGALLADTVKIQGRIVLQIKSEGPAKLLIVECTSKNTLRAYAQWDGDIADDASLADVTGGGVLAITLEVDGAKQPYQGIVSIEAEATIASVLETYFEQSEQLQTRIWLSVDNESVAGLFLQELPKTDEHDDADAWNRVSQLAATVTDEELLGLEAETLLHRLFNEEQCRLLAATELEFACSCSRERVGESIKLLGHEDALALIEEQGQIEANCQFCNELYIFDSVDIAQLFANSPDLGLTTIH
jgi:molecular chaperone Hsp33